MVDDPRDRGPSPGTGQDDDQSAGSPADWTLAVDEENVDPPSSKGDDSSTGGPNPRDGPVAAVRWLFGTENGAVVFAREVLVSALVVAIVGMLLFAISGVWPPMVAVESGSMEPHLERGDLVFVMEETRFAPEYATGETGVVPYRTGIEHGYTSFGSYGDVIVYHPNGNPDRKPVIHRARFWVEEGENWYERADPAYVSGDDCASIPNCPAPHAGFITKGDNPETNGYYDQTRGISEPVKPSWIEGTAEVKVPWLGWIRLLFAEVRAATLAALVPLRLARI
ncbi:MAG: S26 family signal peptidase [Halanaeroarchaeum sp.]